MEKQLPTLNNFNSVLIEIRQTKEYRSHLSIKSRFYVELCSKSQCPVIPSILVRTDVRGSLRLEACLKYLTTLLCIDSILNDCDLAHSKDTDSSTDGQFVEFFYLNNSYFTQSVS